MLEEKNTIKQNLLNNEEIVNHKVDKSSHHNSNNNNTYYERIFNQLKSRTFIVGYVTFINSSCNGLLFPVLWSLCQYLNGNRFDQGLLVASISLGRFLFSTPMGILTDIYRHRLVLFFSSVILMIGSLCWIFASISKHIGVLYIAQFLLGAGSATIGTYHSIYKAFYQTICLYDDNRCMNIYCLHVNLLNELFLYLSVHLFQPINQSLSLCIMILNRCL